ncbi:MAG: nucleoside triphosphate pyrophosphohydrolase [Clostridia bacterium]|nr:nucleoside triphosphate pyrophosphohydrolase [Clostridia bacterium]
MTKNTKAITVVSLGPGPREYLTLGAVETLKKADTVILRTALRCDAADYLREIGVSFETLDYLHEACEDFDELIEKAATVLLEKAAQGPLCYAVFDAAADETVAALREKAPDTVVLPGVPLSAPFLAAAPMQRTVEIQTASSLKITAIQNPLLILECDSRMLLGECKLQLLDWYDPGQPALFFPPSDSAPRTYIELPLSDIDRQPKYDHTSAVLLPPVNLTERKRFDFYDLVRVMDILRGEDGCPWDKEQTHETLKKYLVEEAYETAAAISEEDWDHVADELGDVLLQVVFQANIGRQYGTFELSDITSHICRKMIGRHSHIFGSDHCETADDVLVNWEKIKKEERGYKTQTDVLKGVPAGLPPMMRAAKVQKKARDVGFDWNDPRDALAKVREEADEIEKEIKGNSHKLEAELGDLFFACVNLARLSGIDAESALQKATEKFISRFSSMENAIFRDGKRFQDLTLSEMDVYWESSKKRPEQ